MPPRDPSSAPAAPPAARDGVAPEARAEPSAEVRAGIVDWYRTARRLRWQVSVIAALVVVAWLILGFRAEGPTLRLLAELAGLGLLLAVAGEIVIVGGAAVRGMLAAGERGERLAASDVSLLPPQVSRRLRRR